MPIMQEHSSAIYELLVCRLCRSIHRRYTNFLYADYAGAFIGDIQDVLYANFAAAKIGYVQDVLYADFAGAKIG